MPYLDTPNNGGVYKAWVTLVDDYKAGARALGRPATWKVSCPWLISGGKTSMPIRRQSSICSRKNLPRSEPSISDESTAAMNSVG